MKLISIIGCGEVGSEIITLLLMNPNYSLNIVDPGNISGRLLDLCHVNGIYNNSIHINDHKLLNESDVIIYTAGYCNKQNESRNTVAKKNKELVQAVFKGISPKEDCLIISVSNPVELSALWIDESINSNCKIIGTGTSLDSYRLNYMVKEQLNINDSSFFTPVIGEHGDFMTPIWSVIKDAEKLDQEKILNELKGSAFKIRETEKATKFGIAHTTIHILNSYFNSSRTLIPVSVKINDELKNNSGLKHSIYVSLLCDIGNMKIDISDNFKLNQKEQVNLVQACQHIEEVYINS